MTPKRFDRIKQVLNQRQPDLHVIVESVHKPHNLAAIARSCDAVGALNIHAISARPHITMGQKAAMGTGKWLALHQHRHLDQAVEAVRAQSLHLIAISPGHDARDYREVDYCGPTALIVGTELDGLSEAAVAQADTQVVIPMCGMVASLNVSVACALVLFEAQTQRRQAGLYNACRLASDQYQTLLFEMSHPDLAEYCQKHHLDYPLLDDQGDVCGLFEPVSPVDNS